MKAPIAQAPSVPSKQKYDSPAMESIELVTGGRLLDVSEGEGDEDTWG